MMNPKSMWIAGIALAALCLAVMGSRSGGPGQTYNPNAAAAGLPAPDFSLQTISGGTFTLSQTTGKKHPVLVNFFATWCPGCRQEYPHLQALYEKYKDKGFEIVSVSTEPSALLQSFAKSQGATFALLTDPTGDVTMNKYRADAIPRNILIDNNGRVVADLEGFSPSAFDQQIADVVPKLLAEN